MMPPRYYGRLATTLATRANLPHWSQPCACFVTFRLADSLPAEKLSALAADRDDWLAAHPQPWDGETEDDYFRFFDDRVQAWLDAGHGTCVLRDPSVRQIVERSLNHFADIRYSLYASVVMPNHVHVLFMPEQGWTVPEIVRGWKGYTARQINARLGASGSLWQKESWDRLVRNVKQFNAYRDYIVRNAPLLAFDAYRNAAESGEAITRSGEAISRSLLNKDGSSSLLKRSGDRFSTGCFSTGCLSDILRSKEEK